MNKILLFVSALAGLFLAGSCQREELAPVEEAGVVTFEVNVPGVATKGIGDVPSVDNLVYEVYWTDAETVDATISPDELTLLYKGTRDVVEGKSTVPVELLKDKNYVILFWAQRDNTWGFASEDRLLKNGVTFPDEFRANAEDIEAFYGVSFLTKTELTGSKNVTLYRPFAQLNVGTKLPNDKENPNYTVSLKESKVVVKNAGAKFNLIKQEAEGNKEQITFTSATVPSGVLEANDDSYHYAAMNYIFAAGNVSVQIDITTNDHGTIKLDEIPAVPVAKNYRTNIIGNLLTSTTDYTITLDPDFGEGDYYGPEFVKTPAYDEETKTWTITCRDELLYVAQQVNTGANSFVGQTVKVVNDIDLKNIPWTPIGHSTTVTFRGIFEGAAVTKAATEYPTISNLKIENGSISGFFGLMCNGGKVRNINFNNVTISGERQLGVVAGQVYGNLEQPTIENVTVENAVITAVPALDGAVYDNGDKVGGIAGLIGQEAYIKGCTVKNSTFTGYRDMGGIVGCTQNGHSCNLTDNHTEHINFVVTSKYVPYKDNTPHGATGAIRGGTRSNAGDVIEGNTSSEGTISEVVLVNDQVSLQNAINAAGLGETQIKYVNDITGNVVVIQKPGVKITIDGCNKKYNGFIKVHSNSNHYADAALTIKYVNFEHNTLLYNAKGEPYFNFIEALENGAERYSTNITAENCTFTATGEAKNIAVGLQIKSSKWAKALNCTATDLHSLIQAQSCDETVVVNDCTINGKNGVAFKQVKAATVEDCTINATGTETEIGYGIRFDGNTDNYGIVVKNNTVTAAQPFIVRKMTGKNNTITLEGENTLKSTTNDYQIVITNGSDNEKYLKPTGTYTLSGADNFYVYEGLPVAKVGDTEYDNIAEAITNWTNNTTLTLLDDVTLSDVVTLKSTEHHILNLSTYTMTAASGKNAFEIKAYGTGASERTAITIMADSDNPGSINANKKSIVYYNYADGEATGDDRPIIKIEGGVFYGNTSSFGSAGIYFKGGSAARQAATLNISGGEFHCSINGQSKSKLLISGGLFHYSVGSQGDSTALRLISGGTFKTLGFMTADSKNTKFWFGTSMGNSNVGLYVNDDNYLVVGGPVITKFDDRFEVKVKYSVWNSLLQYSSAAEGLYYTEADNAVPADTPPDNKKWENILDYNPTYYPNK